MPVGPGRSAPRDRNPDDEQLCLRHIASPPDLQDRTCSWEANALGLKQVQASSGY